MPFYEYECGSCHEVVTLEQSFGDHKAPESCPSCKKRGTMHRVFTPAAVEFKGSGWYCTDHHSGSGCCEACKKGK